MDPFMMEAFRARLDVWEAQEMEIMHYARDLIVNGENQGEVADARVARYEGEAAGLRRAKEDLKRLLERLARAAS